MASNSGTTRTSGPSSSNSTVLCRYFANNACNKGSACPFSHDRTAAKPDIVCRYYLAGRCFYGTSCRYDHKRPPSDGNTTTTNSNNTDNRSSQQQQVHSADLSQQHNGGAGSRTSEATTKSSISTTTSSPKLSASAPEFIPPWKRTPQGEITYAAAAGSVTYIPLCPYYEMGNCDQGDDCEFVHGLVCDMCNTPCLHPSDAEQRAQHRNECLAAHEAAMEEAFAEARSADKVCGICMENIRERNARFGILEGCRHCFCLDCIRQWRRNQSQDFEKDIVRSCPECRTHSDFVIPAVYWVEDANDKQKLIEKFRENAKQKQCKYVKNGNLDDCPFGNKCFYKHQLPDGTIAEGKSPRALRRSVPRRRQSPHFTDNLSRDNVNAIFISSDSDSEDGFLYQSS